MPAHKKPRIKKVCPVCDETFEVLPSKANQTFCSFHCFCNQNSIVIVTCQNCGDQFSVLKYTKERRKFCSRKCANAYRKRPVVEEICINCGQMFSYIQYERQKTCPPKFCSKNCQIIYLHRKPRTCPSCGKEYIPKKHADQKYCSPECQNAGRRSTRVLTECKLCGKSFLIIPSRLERTQYCSKHCQMLSMFSSGEERIVVDLISELLSEQPETQFTFPWLQNITNRPMYLDAYFSSRCLAIEYDGKQHRKFMPFYHKTQKQFKELQARDRLKEKLLVSHGIKLLRISDLEPKTREYLKSCLKSLSSISKPTPAIREATSSR